MTKAELESRIQFHLDMVDSLTRQAKLCRKTSSKIKLIGWINRHAKLATELRGKLNGWS